MAYQRVLTFVLLLGFLAISACSTTNAVRVHQTPRATLNNVGSEPEIGVVQTVDVGSTIYSEFEYDVYFDAEISSAFDDSRLLGFVEVPQGERLMGVKDPSGSFQFCSTRNLYLDPMTGPYDIVCFADFNNDLKFDSFRVPAIAMGRWKSIDSPVPYEQVVLDIPVDQGKGMKLELVYQGRDDEDIKIAYREYVDNMARAAFSQIVGYEQKQGGNTVIAFKGARIDVHDANSNQITYTVLKGFDK